MADGYDPRFDPAFQRGYEGETIAKPRQQVRPAPTSERLVAPVATPAEQQSRVFAEAQAQPRPRTVEPEGRREAERFDFETREPRGSIADEPVRLHTNPFIIALLVLAIVLIGGGIHVGSRIDDWYSDVRPNGIDFSVLNMLQFGVPISIGLGVAIVIGVLFLFAIRWRGRSDDGGRD